MGSTVSSGTDNNDLIDNLVKANYIKTANVERVFRSVDRAFYFLPESRHSAYKDMAWKNGNIHISAPCIYSQVLENLNLEPGNSFLNIGSGTGYLSTMVGLLIGPYGTNHGIEFHQDVVDYAYEKLAEFKKTCNAIDNFEFCQPVFVKGNGFCINNIRQYDRIYCGAACPETRTNYMRSLVKVGGILVMPCNEDLLKITRSSETDWLTEVVLAVSFSTLLSPSKRDYANMVSLPDRIPLSLQEICRSCIRTVLREVCEEEHPELTKLPQLEIKPGRSSRRHPRNRLIIFNALRRNGNNPNFPSSNILDRILFEDIGVTAVSSVFRHYVSDDESENDNDNNNNQSNRYDTIDTSSNNSSSSNSSISSSSSSSSNESSDDDIGSSQDSETEVKSDDGTFPNENRTPLSNAFEFVDFKPDSTEIDNNASKSKKKRNDSLDTTELSENSSSNDAKLNKNAPNDAEDPVEQQPKKIQKRETPNGNMFSSTNGTILHIEAVSSMLMDETGSTTDSQNRSSSDIKDEDPKPSTETNDNNAPKITYRSALEEKIKRLLLPPPLKLYVNYNRQF